MKFTREFYNWTDNGYDLRIGGKKNMATSFRVFLNENMVTRTGGRGVGGGHGLPWGVVN